MVPVKFKNIVLGQKPENIFCNRTFLDRGGLSRVVPRRFGPPKGSLGPGERCVFPGATLQLIFSRWSWRLLSFNPLHLLSKSAQSSFYFFECPFRERVFRFHRALLGRGRLLSVFVRTQRHTGRTLERRVSSSDSPNSFME